MSEIVLSSSQDKNQKKLNYNCIFNILNDIQEDNNTTESEKQMSIEQKEIQEIVEIKEMEEEKEVKETEIEKIEENFETKEIEENKQQGEINEMKENVENMEEEDEKKISSQQENEVTNENEMKSNEQVEEEMQPMYYQRDVSESLEWDEEELNYFKEKHQKQEMMKQTLSVSEKRSSDSDERQMKKENKRNISKEDKKYDESKPKKSQKGESMVRKMLENSKNMFPGILPMPSAMMLPKQNQQQLQMQQRLSIPLTQPILNQNIPQTSNGNKQKQTTQLLQQTQPIPTPMIPAMVPFPMTSMYRTPIPTVQQLDLLRLQRYPMNVFPTFMGINDPRRYYPTVYDYATFGRYSPYFDLYQFPPIFQVPQTGSIPLQPQQSQQASQNNSHQSSKSNE